MAKIALPEFPETLKKYYPGAFDRFRDFLKKYEENVRFSEIGFFNTRKNFYNLPVDFQLGRYLKFFNMNDIEVKLDIFERLPDGQKFNDALEAFVIKCFMTLEQNILKEKQIKQKNL